MTRFLDMCALPPTDCARGARATIVYPLFV